MNLSENKQDNVLILDLEGRLDGSNSTQVEQQIIARIEGGDQKLIMDLARLDYVSSAGLRVFLIAAKHLQRLKGAFALCNMSAPVREIFEISGFLEMMPTFPGRKEALQSLK